MRADAAPKVSALDTVRVAVQVLAPVVARGLTIWRPKVVAVLARFGLDRRSVRVLQDIRERHGGGPLRLRVPGRSVAIVLAPGDVERILHVPRSRSLRRRRRSAPRSGTSNRTASWHRPPGSGPSGADSTTP
jgi:hypothetical protein